MRLEKIMNNFHAVHIGGLTIWFSYETPIAIKCETDGYDMRTYVRQNEWGTTTGKHLNYINQDHNTRISGKQFEFILECEVLT